MVETLPELSPSPVCPAPPGLLQALRMATAVQHKALEARLPLTHPDLDQTTYTRIIKAYYGFHAGLQAQAEAFWGVEAMDPERRKLPALIKDLRNLGLSDAQIAALPVCTDLPPLTCEAHGFGISYVMEGATLGGQVLRKIMAARLGIGADNGGEFLDVYGCDTGRLWKAFLARLADVDHADVNSQVVDAARATFSCFERWLDHAGVLQ